MMMADRATGGPGVLDWLVGATGLLVCAAVGLVAISTLTDYLRGVRERTIGESVTDTMLLVPRSFWRLRRSVPRLAWVTIVISLVSGACLYLWIRQARPQSGKEFKDQGSAYIVAVLAPIAMTFGYLVERLRDDVAARDVRRWYHRVFPWVVTGAVTGVVGWLTHRAFKDAASHVPYIDWWTWGGLCAPIWLLCVSRYPSRARSACQCGCEKGNR